MPTKAVLLPFLLATAAVAQTIQITSAPPYGGTGAITGVVTGVPFATHRVAVYIHIEGIGWWTKPSAAAPTVAIQPNGTFAASVYTCCEDHRATILVAALVPAGHVPPLAAGSCGIPAGLQSLAVATHHRQARTLRFAGRDWAVKESPVAVGPGGNAFSNDPGDVFVDAQGRLHLRVVQRAGRWWCSEVVLLDDLGYGTYWFTTESQVGSLDPNVTFGAFTWDPHCDDTTIPAWPNREIDFEDSRWGNAADPRTSQVVVQPWSVPGNTVRYTTPPLQPVPTLTRFFHWTRTRIDFAVATGRRSPCSLPAAAVLHRSSYLHAPQSGQRVPPDGRERFRFNLWLNQGGAPANGQMAEVIVSDFRHAPTSGVFPAGCGINPVGSARVLAGAPVLGGAVALGFDNPAGTQAAGALGGLLLGGPSVGFPCGLLQLGLGMTGPVGELLVDPASAPVGIIGGVWSGAGSPVAFPVAIPNQAALLGLAVVAQGVLLDPVGPRTIGLADGFELCIQP